MNDSLSDKIYICPADGKRYDEPTVCSDGHTPTDTIEYDRAVVEAADNGDADALAKVAETELAVTRGMAGVVPAEATPPGGPLTVPPPVVAEAVDAAPEAPAADEPEPVATAAEPAEPAEPAVDPQVSEGLSAIENAAHDVIAAVGVLRGVLGL